MVRWLTKQPRVKGYRRTQVDGIWFHSKREAERYKELKLMEKAGAIQPGSLRLQVRYPLHVNGIVLGSYVADFVYAERTGVVEYRTVVEDSKGMRTDLYRWKKKSLT